MSMEIKAPSFPESVADGTVATWHKQPGEVCTRDELIVDIETDKVVMEVVAPTDGTIAEIIKREGDTVLGDEVIARFNAGAGAAAPAEEPPAAATSDVNPDVLDVSGPAVRKLLDENKLAASQVTGTGKGGRILKEDVLNYIKNASAAQPAKANEKAPAEAPVLASGERPERRVPMTRLRTTIAKRLLTATNETAMLTTYNEVNMAPVMALRSQYKEQFQKSHNGTKLGFMSFFVKAATEALKRFPAVNASLDGNDIVYHGYQDISVAVSTERGLVVPVLRDTDGMSLADVERGIAELAQLGRDGKLTMEHMQGGTFTITNGGVFGSLMSTPILNQPQTAIMGMHKIQERPVAENGEV
ncbi:MAG: 2-oxoglutarate dehydrogenase complex dihydrolipoyllysine-residue succinyltransferase, partial [Gammaproteobacteria bacterium]|nr:2-oxoglutarate dehydrogenase complex dihydrolipoyllysine-residue succinyltransferase [Gammaproteobacteria bacterium]